MRVYGETNIGNKRPNNQDTFRTSGDSDSLVWMAVCDGMGGVNGGDVASGTAADIIEEKMNGKLKPGLTGDEIKEAMLSAVAEGNSMVFSKAVDNPELKGMGTTAVLAVIKGDKLFAAHVGDSRAYLYSSGNIRQITEDHSYVQDLVNRGEITREQAKVHPHKNIITRSLGVHSIVEIDFSEFDVSEGDVLLICTDGLSDYATEDLLMEYIEKYHETEITGALIEYALECGGNDNITVTAAYI